MSGNSHRCPPIEVLERLARPDSDAVDPDSRAHTESCRECRAELARIQRNNELLAAYVTPSIAGRHGAVTGSLAEGAIPGFRLQREIHRGGQGVIYEALQQSTQRRVAVKVMKEGPFAGAADRARFEREVQILAQLQHPHIVAIHDSGQAAGHFYFVMDYIEGAALDEFAARNSLAISDKLSLFARVCDAVNTAHLLGIIHRDLKPGNILIDAGGDPHILDFGLAKLASQGLASHGADAAVMTLTGQFVGSAPWASPEQAEGAPSGIDVRTDVYSLGVMLYQLLTGRFPYDVAGTLPDVLRRIKQDEPARPSTVGRKLNDELDTIALKCLQKDPGRRYGTAGDVGRDIRHYLAGEPIEAKRDSYFYVLRKQVRRYRVPLAIAATFVLLLIAGLTTSLTFWRQAIAQRDGAETARAEAEVARAEAEASRVKAEEERQNAERENKIASAVSDFFVHMLASADPEKEGREVTVREVVQRAGEKLEGQFSDAPEIESLIRIQIGITLFQLGQYGDAEPHFRKTVALNEKHFGETHQYTLSSLGWLSYALQRLDRLAESLEMQEKNLALHRQALGEKHTETIGAMNNLAMVYGKLGRLAEAEKLYRQVLDILMEVRGPKDTMTLSTMNNLAGVLRELGKLDEAERMFAQGLEASRQARGLEHPRTLLLWSNSADVLFERGQYAEAEAVHREVLAVMERVLGITHPTTLSGKHSLILAIRLQGRSAEAGRLAREVLEQRIEALGNDHVDTAQSRLELGNVLALQKRFEEAGTLFEEALAVMRKSLGEHHWRTAVGERSYADCLIEMGRVSEGEAALEHACAALRTGLGSAHDRTRRCERSLAEVYERTGRTEQAANLRGKPSAE